MGIALYFFAAIGAVMVALLLWNSYISRMFLAVSYYRAAWRAYREHGVSVLSLLRVTPALYFRVLCYLSHGLGRYVRGGEVGGHAWGNRIGADNGKEGRDAN